MITEADVLKLAKWSDPQNVQTKYGERILRKAQPTPEFSKVYETQKAELKALGVGFSKDRDGKWELVWWGQLSQEVQEARAQAIADSKRAFADLEFPHPDGVNYLPFQIAGIDYGLKHPHVLIADEMGLGKTIQAVGIINSDPDINSAIIVCPKSLKLNWYRELTKWLVKPLTVAIVDGTWPTADIVIINYERLNKFDAQIKARSWGACILDEAHLIKNPKTQRSAYIKGRKAQVKAGKETPAIEPIKAQRHIRLTGTPIVNRPADLLNIIDDMVDWIKSPWQYYKRYCGAMYTRFGTDLSGASHLDELQDRLRMSCMVRRLKKDVLKELPPKIRQIIEVEAETSAQREAVKVENARYDEGEARIAALKAEVERLKEQGGEDYEAAVARLRDVVSVQFTEMAKLRHETAVAKAPIVIEHLKTILDDGDSKVVVAGHHKDVIAAIAEGVKDYNPVTLTGDNSADERQKAIDSFQTDPSVRVFIGGIMAAGVGITLTESSHVVFAELDWVPGNITQFEDRCHRIGQTDTVLVQHIVLAESLDARMAKTLVEKQEVADKALDREHEPVAQPDPVKTVETVNSKQVESGLVKSDYDTRHPVEQNNDIYKADQKAMQEMTQQREAVKADKSAALLTVGKSLTPEQVEAIHEGLRILDGRNLDMALERNGIGFNKFDGQIGRSLAQAPHLTPKQAALGQKILRKYRGQLGPELMARITGETNDNPTEGQDK